MISILPCDCVVGTRICPRMPLEPCGASAKSSDRKSCGIICRGLYRKAIRRRNYVEYSTNARYEGDKIHDKSLSQRERVACASGPGEGYHEYFFNGFSICTPHPP